MSRVGQTRKRWHERTEVARADIRDLGFGLPLRAGYELSKKAGTHTAIFRSLRQRTPCPSPAAVFKPIDDLPSEAQDRTIEAADRIVEGEVVLFGTVFRPSETSPWDSYVEREGHWARREWWKLDIRSQSRDSDVKWTWELGRQRHLVVLARAARLRPDRSAYRIALVRGLGSFLDQAPAEIGIHWYSNLEIALRILRWQEILDLVDVGSELRRAMSISIAHARRHLVADLTYTISTMRNNHLLGDTLGIVAATPGWRLDGTTLLARGLFACQLRSELRADGSMTEDSVSYHRFVLEMLAWRLRSQAPRESVTDRAVQAAQYLARLGALDGDVPQFGDWDEGRILCVAGDPRPLAGSVAGTLALAGTGAPQEWRRQWDECAWYAPQGEPVSPEPAVTDGSDVGGGTGRAEQADFTVWLKAGSGKWHGHADLCSSPIRAHGRWLIGDPGTGTYNGAPQIRDHLRSTAAHSALALDGLDQLEPHRAFRWRYTATGVIGPPVHGPGWTLMWGAHDAYRRLLPARRVVRTVFITAEFVAVADWVEGPLGIPWSLSLPLGPAVGYRPDDTVLTLNGRTYPLLVPGQPVVRSGSSEPFAGWWSETYGSWNPSAQLVLTGKYEGPVLWAVGEAIHTVRQADRDVRAAGISWNVTWRESGPTLSVPPKRASHHLDLRAP